jgi:glutamyl-tRNA reductase
MSGSRHRLWLVGLSHHTAPVEVRERLAYENGAAPAALARLCAEPGVEEGAILSTCNRVELVAYGDPERTGAVSLGAFLARDRGLEAGALEPYLYRREDRDAVRHLFRVAASLDSMVVGEPQILGQMKDSYELAVASGTAGSILHRVFHKTFSVAKRVRSETGIGAGNVSISSVAVVLASQIFESLAE